MLRPWLRHRGLLHALEPLHSLLKVRVDGRRGLGPVGLAAGHRTGSIGPIPQHCIQALFGDGMNAALASIWKKQKQKAVKYELNLNDMLVLSVVK